MREEIAGLDRDARRSGNEGDGGGRAGGAQEALPEAERKLAIAMLPKDAADQRPAMLEIRAGTGGDEAALFAGDLYRMYEKFAGEKGWKVEPVSMNAAEVGGFKEIVANVTGQGVFAKMKFESGVHRVQRVPVTESGGRIHTSAATVAVLPEPTEVDVSIDDNDLQDRYLSLVRSGWAARQHYRLCGAHHARPNRYRRRDAGRAQPAQESREGDASAARAAVMRRRRDEAHRVRRPRLRKAMVGSGDRSERIRTYNFPQGRVTDHRIGLTLHKLDEVLAGTGLTELTDALIAEDEAKRLAAMTE